MSNIYRRNTGMGKPNYSKKFGFHATMSTTVFGTECGLCGEKLISNIFVMNPFIKLC